MADHDALDTGVDHGAVHLAERLVPALAVQVVDAHDEVLVQLLHAVTGEVLGADGDPALAHTLHIGLGVADNNVRVVGECAGVHNGVAPVQQNVHDGAERPVAAQSARLPPGDKAHVVGSLGVGGGAARGGAGDVGAVAACAVAAAVTVGGNQQGQLGVLLIEQVAIPDLGGIFVEVTAAADVVAVKDFLHLGRRRFVVQIDEQLPNLFLQRHGADRVFDPGDILIREIKRLCVQIDHNSNPLSCYFSFAAVPLRLST